MSCTYTELYILHSVYMHTAYLKPYLIKTYSHSGKVPYHAHRG